MTKQLISIMIIIGFIPCLVFPNWNVQGEPIRGRVYGVFIGVANYDNTLFVIGTNDLRYSDNDAYKAYSGFSNWHWVDEKYLLVTPDTDDIGGVIPTSTINSDASWTNIKALLESLSRKVNENDIFILYYSGHGYKYGITVSGNGAFTDSEVSYTTLFNYLDNIKSRATILFLDCCYAGSVMGAQMAATKGSWVLGACMYSGTAYEGSTWNGGVFTYRLIQNYNSINGDCLISYNYDEVQRRVGEDTNNNQMPVSFSQYQVKEVKDVNLRTRTVIIDEPANQNGWSFYLGELIIIITIIVVAYIAVGLPIYILKKKKIFAQQSHQPFSPQYNTQKSTSPILQTGISFYPPAQYPAPSQQSPVPPIPPNSPVQISPLVQPAPPTTPTTPAPGSFCIHCGAPMPPGGKFCGSCGAPK